MSSEATIKKSRSYGSVWNQGDLIAAFEWVGRWPAWTTPRYSVLLCVTPREIGPRGGVRAPAEMAVIQGRSWSAVKRAIRSLGFTAPTLTATSLREKFESRRG